MNQWKRRVCLLIRRIQKFEVNARLAFVLNDVKRIMEKK